MMFAWKRGCVCITCVCVCGIVCMCVGGVCVGVTIVGRLLRKGKRHNRKLCQTAFPSLAPTHRVAAH